MLERSKERGAEVAMGKPELLPQRTDSLLIIKPSNLGEAGLRLGKNRPTLPRAPVRDIRPARLYLISILFAWLGFASDAHTIKQLDGLLLAIGFTAYVGYLAMPVFLRWLFVALACVPAANIFVSNLRELGLGQEVLGPVVLVVGVYFIAFLIDRYAIRRPSSAPRPSTG
jgi:hypothetical protein